MEYAILISNFYPIVTLVTAPIGWVQDMLVKPANVEAARHGAPHSSAVEIHARNWTEASGYCFVPIDSSVLQQEIKRTFFARYIAFEYLFQSLGDRYNPWGQ